MLDFLRRERAKMLTVSRPASTSAIVEIAATLDAGNGDEAHSVRCVAGGEIGYRPRCAPRKDVGSGSRWGSRGDTDGRCGFRFPKPCDRREMSCDQTSACEEGFSQEHCIVETRASDDVKIVRRHTPGNADEAPLSLGKGNGKEGASDVRSVKVQSEDAGGMLSLAEKDATCVQSQKAVLSQQQLDRCVNMNWKRGADRPRQKARCPRRQNLLTLGPCLLRQSKGGSRQIADEPSFESIASKTRVDDSFQLQKADFAGALKCSIPPSVHPPSADTPPTKPKHADTTGVDVVNAQKMAGRGSSCVPRKDECVSPRLSPSHDRERMIVDATSIIRRVGSDSSPAIATTPERKTDGRAKCVELCAIADDVTNAKADITRKRKLFALQLLRRHRPSRGVSKLCSSPCLHSLTTPGTCIDESGSGLLKRPRTASSMNDHSFAVSGEFLCHQDACRNDTVTIGLVRAANVRCLKGMPRPDLVQLAQQLRRRYLDM
eukprot:TRINITY_DN29312_c0_g1_i1.p1 TRINITY_DN29312_c0_g1~~TRINITY_DN29312_c0_g1_i1.p1  ORF type:complete len:489 (+),score=66.92 TRINITY_DN29312_c0_g1_i1:114-1580(+)